jgi:hypothetical protein
MISKLLWGLIVMAVMLFAACTSPIGSPPRLELLGDPAPVSAATRTIVIAPHTRYVNVTGGELAKFVVGDKSFAWHFDAAEYFAPFDLRLIAPPGMLDHKVMVYVAPNPFYHGIGVRGGHGGGHK